MKSFLLATGLLLVPGIANAQLQGDCPRRSNTLNVHFEGEAEDAFRRAASILRSQGYAFRSTDATLLSIDTEAVRERSYHFAVNVTVSDQIEIRGTDEFDDRVDFRGAGGSPTLRAWQRLLAIADAFEAPYTCEREQR